MTLEEFLSQFGVRADSCASIAVATDGLGSKANVLMIAMHTFGEDPKEISAFISGGDCIINQRFHGIPKQVYDSTAAEPEVVADIIKRKLNDYGISNLVCVQAFKFVKPKLKANKLIDNEFSFIDVGLMDKALGFWTGNLSEANNLNDLQGKIQNMRGSNTTKLDSLADFYDIGKPKPPSPYIPLNKAWQVREIFQKQLEADLPF
jgi:hypothetical protein